jgi:hypothetical protein
MGEMFRKASEAAEYLGVGEGHLTSLIRRRAISLPRKDSSGDYLWSDVDLEAAKKEIDRRKAQEAEWLRKRNEKQQRLAESREMRLNRAAAKLNGGTGNR